MDHLLILLVGALILLVRKLFMEGGLAKILGKLDSDLNAPDRDLRRTTPNPARQTPAARSSSLSPEEDKMRKFREALGLPLEDLAPRSHETYPIPPIISQPMSRSPSDRAREERERIERKLAEKKRALQRRAIPTTPPPAAPVKDAEEDSVSKYFQMEQFDRPDIVPEKTSVAVQVYTPIMEPDFFKTLEKKELVTVSSATRLNEIFGTTSDLRRLVLAQEILGRPKSLLLQNV